MTLQEGMLQHNSTILNGNSGFLLQEHSESVLRQIHGLPTLETGAGGFLQQIPLGTNLSQGIANISVPVNAIPLDTIY